MSKAKSSSTQTTKKAPVKIKTTAKKPVRKTVTKAKPKKKTIAGRPSSYNDKIAAKICSYIALGESMRTVCKRPGMPAMSTIFRWLSTNEIFQEQYARAKEEAADVLIEDILDIADDGTNDFIPKRNKSGEIVGEIVDKEAIQRSRLRIDTRKWLASKLKPKKYGDRLSVESKSELSGKLEHSHAYENMPDDQLREIAAKYAKGDV